MTSDASEIFLYVITTGWKSGQPHEIEIWYVEHVDSYYIVAEHRERAHWVQNIQHNSSVQVRLGKTGDWRPAQARVISPTTDADLASQVSRLMDAKYEWSDGLIVEIHPISGESA
jgi:deazaflavin-dependent oxidoreductase (nitroreductase family)